MTITIKYITGENKDAPVISETFENVANPGVAVGAFLQLNEIGGRIIAWIPLARIIRVGFENNSLTGVQLAH